jgi:fructose-bisphosphate aldolase class I
MSIVDCKVIDLLNKRKGILLLDETEEELDTRFKKLNLFNMCEMRRTFREMVIRTKQLNRFISGIVINEETLEQSTWGDKQSLTDLIVDAGIQAGVRIPERYLNLTEGRMVVSDPEGLKERLKKYRSSRVSFARIHGRFKYNGEFSEGLVRENCEAMAQIAKYCEEEGLYPLVQPHLVLEKPSSKVFMEATLCIVNNQASALKSLLAKPNNTVLSFKLPAEQDYLTAVRTLDIINSVVGTSFPGVSFLYSELDYGHSFRGLKCVQKLPSEFLFNFCAPLPLEILAIWNGNVTYNKKTQHTIRCSFRKIQDTMWDNRLKMLRRKRLEKMLYMEKKFINREKSITKEMKGLIKRALGFF